MSVALAVSGGIALAGVDSDSRSCVPGASVAVPVVAMNVGGPEVTIDGRIWSADRYGAGGHVWTSPATADVAGTELDALYRTERAAQQFTYNIPAANGYYLVRLHLAEIYWGAPGGSKEAGKRVETFNIEGGFAEIQALDPAAVQGVMKAQVYGHTARVKDQALTITSKGLTDFAALQALEVYQITVCGVEGTPTPAASPFPSSSTAEPSPEPTTPAETLTPKPQPSTSATPSDAQTKEVSPQQPASLPTQLKPSGPLTVSSGQTIRGLRITNPDGPCLTVSQGASNVLIEGNDIGPCGAYTNIEGVGIDIKQGAHNITMANNRIHGVSAGAYALKAQHPLVFTRNVVYDVRGPFWRGQMIQFNQVSGGSGQTKITYNISDKNLATEATHYEDHINMYSSTGSAEAPILIGCNKIRGGDSKSGSGIVVGDYSGQYFDIRNNILVYTANTGIGVAGGQHVKITGNLIFNDGPSPDMLTLNAINLMSYAENVPDDITITNNRGIARGWKSGVLHGGFWSDGTATNLTETSNTWLDKTLNENIWNNTPTGCD